MTTRIGISIFCWSAVHLHQQTAATRTITNSTKGVSTAKTTPTSWGHAPTGAAQDRCGYGPRIPLLVISPYAKVNFVDHSIRDLSSILRFIEDNWGLGRIGKQSFDVKAGLINNMFDLNTSGHAGKLILDPTTGTQNSTAAK